jgi:ribokinase
VATIADAADPTDPGAADAGGRVIIVGSLNQDTILSLDRLPRAGETIHSLQRVTRVGGKGANQAVASARFGAATTLVGCVGADRAGDDAVANLEANGVATHAIARSKSATGTAVVLVDAQGENEVIVSSGANADLRADTVQRALAGLRLRSNDIVGVGFEVSEDAVSTTIAAVAAAGAHLVINPSPVRPLPAPVTTCRSTIVVNESEAGQLASAGSAQDAATELAARFDSVVILTLGPKGALLTVDGDTVRVPAPRMDALDTVGAGDTLFGTYCARLAAGASGEEAVRLAVTAAALAVTAHGAQDGMPTVEQVMRSPRPEPNRS